MTPARLLPILAALAAMMPSVEALAQASRGDAQRSEPIRLAPHRAVYDFALGTVRSSRSVSAMSGRMVYELTGSACEGYTQTMRFVTRTVSSSGESSVSDQRSTTWEDDTGMKYKFQSSQYRDQKLIEQTAGSAQRGDGDADIRVDLTHPDQRRTAVGGGAMFPVHHSIKLLEAARRGQPQFVADFFDGSEGGEKSYVVAAQIGKMAGAGFNKTLPRAGQADKLDGMQAWPLVLSYFEHGSEKKDALPTYEMSFVFYINGVSRRIVIDNGDYTMKGELSDLTMLTAVPCRR